jgi:hypothetical protein
MSATQHTALVEVNAMPPPRFAALIDGASREFRGPEEKFHALVDECRRLRETGSSTASAINDAYGQIVAMGWAAVPLLLREVQLRGGHWFTALKWITGENLVGPEMAGDIRAIREVWLRWGKEHGYITGDVQGSVDAAVSARTS